MAADANERDVLAQEGEVQTDRRNFIRSAAAAGLLALPELCPCSANQL